MMIVGEKNVTLIETFTCQPDESFVKSKSPVQNRFKIVRMKAVPVGLSRRRLAAQIMCLVVVVKLVVVSSLTATTQTVDTLSLAEGSKRIIRARLQSSTSEAKKSIPASIPAANANFEAAFQGECGDNNSNNNNSSNGNNPCEHICLDLHDGTYECSCFYGFTLAVDGYSCASLTSLPQSHSSSSRGSASNLGPQAFSLTGGAEERVSKKSLAGLGLNSSLDSSEPPENDNRKLAAGRIAGGPRTENSPKLGPGLGEIGSLREQPLGGQPLGQLLNRPLGSAGAHSRRLHSRAQLGRGQFGGENEMAPRPANGDPANRQELIATAEDDEEDDEEDRSAGQRPGIKEAEPGTNMNTNSNFNSSPSEAKWPRYQVFAGTERTGNGDDDNDNNSVHEDGAANQNYYHYNTSGPQVNRLLGPKAAESEPVEELDADIKSIMRDNDNRLKHLASLVSNAIQSDRNWPGKSSNANASLLDYDLGLLEQLVDKTIGASYNRSVVYEKSALLYVAGDADESEARAKTNSAASEQIDAANASSAFLLSASESERNSVSSQSGQSDAGNINSLGQANVVSDDVDLLCNDSNDAWQLQRPGAAGERRGRRRFENCSALADKCESGGQCVLAQRKNGQRVARCRCPIGRGGIYCEKPIQREIPKFGGHSYIALPMINSSQSITQMRLLFKPELAIRRAKSLLVFHSTNFVLILDESGRVELRFLNSNSPSGGDDQVTMIIGSKDIEPFKWNELILTDALTDNQIVSIQDDSINRITLVTPRRIQLNPEALERGELFLGGLPEARTFDQLYPYNSISGEGTENFKFGDSNFNGYQMKGFLGCIKEFSINGREYDFKSDLRGDSLDGFDISECCK